MSDTINGFPIIATWDTPRRGCEREGRIIVVDRGSEYEERFVVAFQGQGSHGGDAWDRHWTESAYCLDLAEASRVFGKWIEREVRK